MSKQRLADLVKIVQEPPLRQVFDELMRTMRQLPLPPVDLADFLRLTGYDEICGSRVPDDALPVLIAQLQRFQSKSAEELADILLSLRAHEWPPVRALPNGPILEPQETAETRRETPTFRVQSFHDPPGAPKASRSLRQQLLSCL